MATGERRVRFLHTADWQLGMTRHFLDADAQPRYTAARIDAVGALADLARREQCEFAVVCGDVFETRAVGSRVVRRAAERLAEFDVPVYLLPGNHDPLDAASIFRSPAFIDTMPTQVRVLDRVGRHPVRPGVEIVAAPWFSKRPTGDLAGAALAGLEADGTTRILAAHGTVDVLSADPTDPTMIRTATIERALNDATLAYVALGDRHSATSVGDSGRIRYPGTPVATDYDEVAPGRALVVTLDPDTITVDEHVVGGWVFADVVRRLDGAAGVDRLLAELSLRPAKDTTVVRLSLTGTLTLAEQARWGAGLGRLREVFAAIEVWDKGTDLVVTVDDHEHSDLGLDGYAGTAIAELALVAAGGGADRQTARDALSLAYRLAGGGR